MRTCVLCWIVGLSMVAGCSDGSDGNPTWPPDATVHIDSDGIFHGDCATDEDCTMALGYFHARDRFFQMDVQRRLSTGRLTDIVDKAFVEQVGLLEGLIETAAANRALYSTRDGRPGEEVLLEGTDESVRRLLAAYSAGVNAWLEDVRNGENGAIWPAEFSSAVLDYPPEAALAWQPSDSMAVFFTLVGSLTIDDTKQVRAQAARDQIDDNERYLDLWSLEPIKRSPVLEEGTFTPATAALEAKAAKTHGELRRRAANAVASLGAKLDATEGLRRIFPETQIVGADIGSNNWVLGPSMTANDLTFMSNDPHLGLSQPPVWYIAHLDAKTNGRGAIHAAGVTLAGIPHVVMGQNENIAWGATNTGFDFSDLYIEELVKDDQGNPIGVMFNGEVVEFVRVDFELSFSDGTAETRELLFVPHHGPVQELDAENDVAITLRWTGNDMDTDANIVGLLSAATVEEAREVLTNVTSLGQNWVVIDNQGNFGWFPYNRIPKRMWATNLDLTDPTEPFPWLPLPGTGEYEWNEFFTPEELPQAFNRENGWIATANSDLTGAAFDGNPTNDGFAPLQTDNIAAGYRTARIVELIEETDQHTRATNEAIISDVQSLIGREMVPRILEIANADETTLTDEAQKVVNVLTAWGEGGYECPTGLDGSDPVMAPLADPDEVAQSSGCTAWHQAIREIDSALAQDESNKEFPSFVTFYSIMDASRLQAGDVYWDDVTTEGIQETRFDIIGAALDTAGSALVAEYGENEFEWPWGRKHGFRLTNLLADLSAAVFSQFNIPAGRTEFFANDGGLFTVDVANPNAEGIHRSGPSTRLQCEGAAPVSCTIQLPGGQSSHASSPNYVDLLPGFIDNEPTELIFDIGVAADVAAETFDLRSNAQ